MPCCTGLHIYTHLSISYTAIYLWYRCSSRVPNCLGWSPFVWSCLSSISTFSLLSLGLMLPLFSFNFPMISLGLICPFHLSQCLDIFQFSPSRYVTKESCSFLIQLTTSVCDFISFMLSSSDFLTLVGYSLLEQKMYNFIQKIIFTKFGLFGIQGTNAWNMT